MSRLYLVTRWVPAVVVALWVTSCSDVPAPSPPPQPRVEEMTLGPVTLSVTADPGTVRPDRDMLLTIHIACPSEMDVAQPALDDRVQGFDLSGFFAVDPVDEAGRTRYEYRARLTPKIAEEYRLAPMALQYTDRSSNPATTGWIATRPIVFESEMPAGGSGIQTKVKPVWIRPAFVTMLWWIAAAALCLCLVYGGWRLARCVKRTVELRRMSPRERAMRELQELLARDLPAHHQVKEFYLELTMIVRRYIERRHGIRAPEQTTEEFLSAVKDDSRFTADVVERLGRFLAAADLVKFATHRPEATAVQAATGTAGDYIRTDDAAAEKAEESEAANTGKGGAS